VPRIDSASAWPDPDDGASDYNYEITATSASTADIVNSNYQLWRHWNSKYTQTTGSCNYGWPFIVAAGSATNYTINQYVWNAWIERSDDLRDLRAVTDVQTLQRFTRRKLSEDELRAALAEEKRLREEAEARMKKAEEAKARAEELLRTCLSSAQKEDLDKKNCFYIVVDGKNGKKERYRIDRGSHGNVKQVDEKGSIIRSFCIQPTGVPEGDVLLTQKLWLESSDETRAEFWATANITTLQREKEVPATIPRSERRRYAEMHGLLH
jgi:hypothetical protein